MPRHAPADSEFGSRDHRDRALFFSRSQSVWRECCGVNARTTRVSECREFVRPGYRLAAPFEPGPGIALAHRRVQPWVPQFPGPPPGHCSREPQGCIVCTEPRGRSQNSVRRTRPAPRPPFAGPFLDSSLAISGNPGTVPIPAARRSPGLFPDPGCQPAPAPAALRYPGLRPPQAVTQRHGPDPPGSPGRISFPVRDTRSSTTGYFPRVRSKVASPYMCAAGGHWSGGSVALAVLRLKARFEQSTSPARTARWEATG